MEAKVIRRRSGIRPRIAPIPGSELDPYAEPDNPHNAKDGPSNPLATSEELEHSEECNNEHGGLVEPNSNADHSDGQHEEPPLATLPQHESAQRQPPGHWERLAFQRHCVHRLVRDQQVCN